MSVERTKYSQELNTKNKPKNRVLTMYGISYIIPYITERSNNERKRKRANPKYERGYFLDYLFR